MVTREEFTKREAGKREREGGGQEATATVIKDIAGRSTAVPLSSPHYRWVGRDFSKPNTARNYTDLPFGGLEAPV